MKLLAAGILIMFAPLFAFAQGAPSLDCAVTYKSQSSKMYWFAQNQSHHSDSKLDTLTVLVKEKAEPGKAEITIVEAVADDVWDKFSEITDNAGLDETMKKKIRALGRTRVTHAYVGLYAGVLQYEFRLGTDPNLYEISCRQL